jgi:putative ferrous iron transport protein C
MSLLDIRNHMMQVKMASLASLCSLFKVEPDTLRCMLSHWIRKGKMRQCSKKPACGSKCFKCPTATIEIYEWIAV